jgi:lipopolysaccharide export system protein LptA
MSKDTSLKTCPFNPGRNGNPTRLGWLLILFSASLIFFESVPGLNKVLAENKNGAKIEISADKLITDNNAQTAEFIGNVSFTRGTSVIRAGRITIYFEQRPANKKVEADRKEMVKKFVARDNVRIDTEKILARADKAVYARAEKTIVLSGPNVQVTRGNNSLAGTQITLYIETEDVRIVSGEKQRVEAVFSPDAESKP